MAPAVNAVHSQWLAQLAEMRSAIAGLNLPVTKEESDGLNGSKNGDNVTIASYGADILARLDERDLFRDDGMTTTATASDAEDELWDLISEEDDEEQGGVAVDGGDLASVAAEIDSTPKPYSLAWLAAECYRIEENGSGLEAQALQEQVVAVLVSDSSDDELQMLLADTLGYTELDLVASLISHRSQIVAASAAAAAAPEAARPGLLGKLQTKREREEALRRQDREHKAAPLADRVDRGDGMQYPHVYRSHEARNTVSVSGKKYALPVGHERIENEKYEEYSIPASQVGVVAAKQKLIMMEEMDGLCRNTFRGYKSLNRMQSLVYQVAYKTSENMLICAPTGAGKTDAAMLTILNIIGKYTIPNPIESPHATDFTVNAEEFKIVYVAPMKALAAEVTEKLGKRLAWLGIQARELTGDMHLTKAEIVQTQIIVTTPEKWDVVTRKSTGDTELVQKVRLLIIDEVHMLHDERGAVLESLVARTERQVESTQSLIRIVGLSATLPNFIDVADFLKVNRMAGLFYFDASFRPVPLEQHFVGVKGKPGTVKSKENLEQVAFDKVADMLRRGHQVMVFVHSRKDTFKSAKMIMQKAMDEQCLDLLDPTGHPKYDNAVRDIKTSKGRELRELVPNGLGTHHAGMPRSDRNLMERLFAEGVIKVLCCTATLAWGVNLPAAAVVIKGTQLYSAQEGKFVDLGILDVLQIFGRAGRPQFQDTGIGFICTTQDKLQHYLSAITQQLPIESSFSKRMVDNLNAEIGLGTVTSVAEAVQWLGYSYLFVRMKKAPHLYGIEWAEIRDDPHLVQRRRKLIIDAARILQRSQMIIFNETTEELRAKDVGRIASQYYVLQTSIEIFNTMMRPRATEADVLKMISMSGEFDNIQSRESEEKELMRLMEDDYVVPCQVEGGIGTAHGKTNVLLQSHISRSRLEDYTLVSDTAYVAQNAARICRALFMIALNRRWGYQCLVLLSLCKSIERQIWPYQHPFHQFDLPAPVLRNLDEKSAASASIEALRDMDAPEIGELVHNQKMGNIILKLLDNFPTLSIEAEIAPLNRDVLRIRLFITPDFRWNDRHHGTSESFWIWVENSETSEIYHHEFFILSRKKLFDDHELNFTIPLSDPLPSQIYIRAVSDRWLGAETVTPVSFQHLIRPDTESVYTDLLNLQPLPISALKNETLEAIYGQRFQYFNPMQSQIFHCMYHTSSNVLLGSPTGSGKTVACELAMWWAFRENPGSKVVYIAPMKALVRERVQDWNRRLTKPMGLRLVELTGDNTPDTRTIRDADIIITTPEKWDGISRSWQTRDYVRKVSLVIIDEIHLLGGDRGPILEIIVSRMNYIASQKKGAVRLVGMSTAAANASDLANWLGVKQGLFNFRHSVRPVPLEIFIDGFPEQRGFCPLMQSMNRPTFLAIKAHSPEKPVIVFVASRRQTRLTARDLINFCGMEDNPRRFVRMPEEDLAQVLSRVKDEALREALSFGIGLHHAGLVETDRQLAEELFANNKIQILVATSTLAWGVNLPAHLVVVKGTQFFDAKTEAYKDMDLTDVLQMLGRAGRPQFDSSGIARIFTQDSKKAFYKHFLHTGFPVESSLHKVLDNHLAAEISAETVKTTQDALDYLTWTFFFRRIHKNPSYYGLEISAEEHNTMAAQNIANEFMLNLVNTALNDLVESRCIMVHTNGDVEPTPLGKIMSYYYLSHKTIRSLVQYAKPEATFIDVLAWLTRAAEYDELPVRHNEDLINAELAARLPLDPNSTVVFANLPMWDPHVKAFLLLQAHFSRVDLPISDYVGDLNSVLDQSIRIAQASIDVLTELGMRPAAVQMIHLLQCIKSARWPEDGSLSILPGVNPEHEKRRLQSTTSTDTAGKGKQRSKSGPINLVEAVSSPSPDQIASTLGVPAAMKRTFITALATLPKLQVEVRDITALQLTVSLTRTNSYSNPPKGHQLAPTSGSGQAVRRGKGQQQRPHAAANSASREVRMYAPRFPKPQTEGFFVLVTDRRNPDELVALKRVGWQPGTSPTNLKARALIKLPPEQTTRMLDVFVLSDGYPGMEWTIKEVEVPAVPVGEGGKKKEDAQMANIAGEGSG